MPKVKSDPLIAALIARLPANGVEWPTDQQLAWLRLMAMAFGTVYGGDASSKIGSGSGQVGEVVQFRTLHNRPKKPEHRFIIDEKGYARKGTGERIMPDAVDGEMFDKRGIDGDMRTIIWADDTQGLPQKQLVISA